MKGRHIKIFLWRRGLYYYRILHLQVFLDSFYVYITREEGLSFVYIGNTELPDAEDTFCPRCGRLLVRRRGYNIVENYLDFTLCPYCGCDISGRWQ